MGQGGREWGGRAGGVAGSPGGVGSPGGRDPRRGRGPGECRWRMGREQGRWRMRRGQVEDGKGAGGG